MPLNIIADGDSWNSYPKFLLTGGGLADHLSTMLGVPITNYAHPGDSTIETMGLTKCQRLEQILPNADVLFFSGGGDDICGDQFAVWLNKNINGDVTTAVNWDRLTAILDLIIADYEDLVSIRDAISPNCWIVTHSYDFPVAEKLGVGVLWLGPWLKPGLDWRGWTNANDQVAIVKSILIRFNMRLNEFANQQTRFCHINTQGTLSPEDWGNEIHPNGQGWTKLARVINLQLLPIINSLTATQH